MPKIIRCRDAGVDCDFVVMKEIPKDLQEKMRMLIREEKAA